MRWFRSNLRRPSPAMLVAIVALVVALGGTSYSASTLVSSSGPQAQSANGDSGSAQGPRGLRGRRGKTGPRGRTGSVGSAGAQGIQGVKGDAGTSGANGVTGPAGLAAPSEFAQFYALMPPDNAATVAVGGAVEFPQDGPNNGTIARSGPGTFVLPSIGTYRVAFTVSVSEAGQLQLSLNTIPIARTVSGRSAGTSLISEEVLIETTVINSVVSVINPLGNVSALTITPSAGGAAPAAALLVIEQVE